MVEPLWKRKKKETQETDSNKAMEDSAGDQAGEEQETNEADDSQATEAPDKQEEPKEPESSTEHDDDMDRKMLETGDLNEGLLEFRQQMVKRKLVSKGATDEAMQMFAREESEPVQDSGDKDEDQQQPVEDSKQLNQKGSKSSGAIEDKDQSEEA